MEGKTHSEGCLQRVTVGEGDQALYAPFRVRAPVAVGDEGV